ncbi:hypothetical protein TNCV_1418611 [Trichonephila clavipes]|nr:hypothetical protein TNCV_1418611 [Trichonephila clavipes]
MASANLCTKFTIIVAEYCVWFGCKKESWSNSGGSCSSWVKTLEQFWETGYVDMEGIKDKQVSLHEDLFMQAHSNAQVRIHHVKENSRHGLEPA